MKKQIMAVSLSTAFLALSAPALADVTLYGKVDAGFGKNYTNSVSQTKVDNQGTYVGIKGSEDLSSGNGLKAIWQLEQGVPIDGNDSQKFSDLTRDTFIGLQSESFGTVKLGKNSSSYKGVGSELDLFPDHTASVESGFGVLNSRIKNSIKYDTPSFGGLTASVTYGTERPTQGMADYDSKANIYSTGVNYQVNNNIKAGVAYERANDLNSSQDYQYGIKVASSYTFDNNAMLGAGWERVVYNSNGDSYGIDFRSKRDAMTLSGLYPVSNFDIKGNYTHVFDTHDRYGKLHDSGANIYTAGVDYNLSKRTKVGGYYSYIDNNKGAGFNFSNNSVDGAKVGENTRSYGVNLSHQF